MVGSQFLDLAQLKKDVEATNNQLKSLGVGINLDMSDIVRKQVKSVLDQLVAEVKRASSGVSTGTKQISGEITGATTKIAALASETVKYNSTAGTALTSVQKGYTEVGQAITEVWKNGQKVSSSITVSDNIGKANILYAEQSKLLKSLYEMKTKITTETDGGTVANLNEQVTTTQWLIDMNDQIISGMDAQIVKQSKIVGLVAEEERLKQQLAKTQATQQKSTEFGYLNQAKQAYRELMDGYKGYNNAVRNGNQESTSYWQKSIDGSIETLNGLEKIAQGLNEESDVRRQIIALIQKAKDAQDAQADSAEKFKGTTDKIVSRLIQMASTFLIMRGLSTLWREATTYAQSYYDKMNEIRIVSMQTEEYADHLGSSYRRLAKNMSVSSTEIATAAVEFWRQGLSEADVNERLQETTKYAKISGMEFASAAEIVTAATNAMEVDAQRAVDVFTYLGDASASGADEVGISMQKASASAKEFGLTFEWLGAYIATMSEKTRQAPEVIGTSQNAMLARLHSIKQKGFNDEDETKINDIAKALGTVNIKLLDQDNDWRAMSDIFDDIAAKWGAMDAKQKAYISTTLAGVRQQNYFLTLMNDMSKGVDGGSRAYELYAGAISSAGIATEKYTIWQESVTAAQNSLKISLEELYALLDADWMKGFYNGMSSFVTMISNGTESVGGMNLVIPALAAGLIGIGIAMNATAVATGAAAFSFSTLWAVLSAHPIALAISAFVVLTTAVTGISSQLHKETVDISESLSNIQNNLDDVKTAQRKWTTTSSEIEALRLKYIELSTKTDKTKEDNEALEQVLKNIGDLSPSLATNIQNITDKYSYQSGIVSGLNAELKKNYDWYMASARLTARDTFGDLATTSNDLKSEEKRIQEKKNLVDDFNKYVKEHGTPDMSMDQMAGGWLNSKTIGKRIGEIEKIYNHIGSVLGVDGRFVGNDLTFFDDGKYQSGIETNILEARSNVDDQISVLEGQKEALKQAVYDTLAVFADYNELTPAYQRYAEGVVNGLINEFDFESSDLGSEINRITAAITDAISKALSEQTNTQADSNKSALMNQIESAYNAQTETMSMESLASYNSLIDEWNKLYGSDDVIKFGKLDESFIDSLKATANAAAAAAKSLDGTTTSAEEYAKTVSQRTERQDAEKNGFLNQLGEAKTKIGDNGENLGEYRAYMNQLSEKNSELYQAMMDTYPSLAEIYTGSVAGQDAVNALNAATVEAAEIAASKENYYATISSNTTASSGSDVQGWLQQLKDSLVTGGDENGVASFIAQLDTMSNESIEKLIELMPWLSTLKEETYSYKDLLTMLNGQIDGTYENLLQYMEQISNMDNAGTDQSIGQLTKLEGFDGSVNGIDAFKRAWGELDDSARKAIRSIMGDEEDLIDSILEGGEDAEDSFKKINKALNKMKLKKLEDLGQVWEGTTEAMENAEKGGTEFVKSYGKIMGKVDDLSKAQGALNFIQSEGTKDAGDLADAFSYLAQYTGVSAEHLQNNLDPAIWAVNNDMYTAANTAGYLAQMLMTTTGVQFTASNWQAQQASLASSADATTANVAVLISTMLQASGASLYMDGGTVNVKWGSAGSYAPPSAKKSSGGGGGGGNEKSNESSTKAKTEIEKMLELMERVNEFQEHKRSMYQSTQKLYESKGQFQGVIKYLGLERDAILAQSEALDSNVEKIKAAIVQKEKEMAGLNKNSDAYQSLADELKSLQDALMDYEQQAIDSQTELEEVAQRIKEIQDEIRDMEIDLRETIQQAIEDREELKERMLQGTIDVENEIMDVLKERYEKEQDQILENAELKKQALEDEMNAIDEQLNKRKQLAEQEDKQVKLAELEAKLARISADPTRKKEALSISEEIADLRKDIAWDLADQEAEVQKDSIEQQLTSLEDYMEYVESYYNDLFEHPKKLIEEMQNIISMTDEDIMAWLEHNSSSYAESTSATQEDMRNSWQAMLDDMNGSVTTHWDEVESIIAQGDEAIIQFLMEHSADYQAAGKLQAEAYVDEWKQKLEDLRKAYQDVSNTIQSTDFTPHIGNGGGDSGSGSSGGGGGGGGGGSRRYQATYPSIGSVKGDTVRPYGTEQEAWNAAAERVRAICRQVSGSNSSSVGQWAQQLSKQIKVSAYKKGGIVSSTGLAWVDGSKADPERILSPDQTANFEDLLETLHAIKMLKTPSMPYVNLDKKSDSYGMTVEGNIVVNVESLSSDEDYEEMAAKVKESIYREMSKGSVVGGIRLGK